MLKANLDVLGLLEQTKGNKSATDKGQSQTRTSNDHRLVPTLQVPMNV